MAIIQNIANSFIQFNNGQPLNTVAPDPEVNDCLTLCDTYEQPCLPMNDITDIAFQILIDASTENFRDDFAIGVYTGSGCPDTVEESDFIETYTGTGLEFYEIDTFHHILTFSPVTNINLCEFIDNGDCLKLVLYDAGTGEVYTCSNCFEFTQNVCYTALLKYRNNENAYGFYYEEQIIFPYTDFYNKIRLWMTKHSPQFPKKKKVFRLSDGSHQKLSASIRKEYNCLIDLQPEQFHQAMSCAIEHDYIAIYNEVTGEFEEHMADEDDDYKIQWLNENGNYTHLGQATFKFKPTPFYQENSNCV